MTTENTQVLLGGDFYIDPLDGAGNSLGLIGPLNTEAFKITQSVEEKNQTSRMRDTFGQTRASVNLPQPATISVTLADQPAAVLAMAFLSEESALAVVGATVTNEAVTVILDRWQQLSKQNLTASSVVVQDAADTITYVEGSDYEVNYRLGLIRFLSTGSVLNAATAHVDFAYGSIAGTRIIGGAKSQIKARLILDGKNMVNDKTTICQVYEATLRPDGEIDLNSGEYITTTLVGTMVTPTGQTGPFVLDEWS